MIAIYEEQNYYYYSVVQSLSQRYQLNWLMQKLWRRDFEFISVVILLSICLESGWSRTHISMVKIRLWLFVFYFLEKGYSCILHYDANHMIIRFHQIQEIDIQFFISPKSRPCARNQNKHKEIISFHKICNDKTQ